jgi:hypothetical protein
LPSSGRPMASVRSAVEMHRYGFRFDPCPLYLSFGRIVLEASHDRTEPRAATGDRTGPARADHRSLDARCLRRGPGRGLRAPDGGTAATGGTAPSANPARDPSFATRAGGTCPVCSWNEEIIGSGRRATATSPSPSRGRRSTPIRNASVGGSIVGNSMSGSSRPTLTGSLRRERLSPTGLCTKLGTRTTRHPTSHENPRSTPHPGKS